MNHSGGLMVIPSCFGASVRRDRRLRIARRLYGRWEATEITKETVSQEERRNEDERSSLATKDAKITKATKSYGRSIGRRRRPAAMNEGTFVHRCCRRAARADQSNGPSVFLRSFVACMLLRSLRNLRRSGTHVAIDASGLWAEPTRRAFFDCAVSHART